MHTSSTVGRKVLTGEFSQLVKEMASWQGWSSPTVTKSALSMSRCLFRWLRDQGHENMASVRLEDLRTYYMLRMQEVPHTQSTRYKMKLVFRFMVETGRIGFDPLPVLRLKVAQRTKLLPAMDEDKITRILDAINRDSIAGKRDYAIILMGVATGLRISDIANLRLKDIDWREGRISIVQRKTSKAISLPLLQGIGNALEDYILNGRGDTGLENVFLSADGTRPISSIAATSMFLRRCRNAGVARTPRDGLSFHSLRRSVGKRLCTAGVPLTTIAQCLGHWSPESAERYINLDTESLAGCALGFDGIGEGGALWN